MAAYIALFGSCWAAGYMVGWQIRMIRRAVSAST
jgi:hypothetical protein